MTIRKIVKGNDGRIRVYLSGYDIGDFFWRFSSENGLEDDFELYVFVAEFCDEDETRFWLYGVGNGVGPQGEMYAQPMRVRCRLIADTNYREEKKVSELEEDDEFVFEIDTYPVQFELVDALPSYYE